MIASDILQQSPLQGKFFAIPAIVGFITVVATGVLACVAIVLAFAWLVLQIALTLLQAVIEVLTSLAATYTAADPTIKIIVLFASICLIYRIHRQRTAARRA